MRKPNHTASGESMVGKEVNYDASTGDKIVLNGYTFDVKDTYPHGIVAVYHGECHEEGFKFTYRELKRRGAFYAAI